MALRCHLTYRQMITWLPLLQSELLQRNNHQLKELASGAWSPDLDEGLAFGESEAAYTFRQYHL